MTIDRTLGEDDMDSGSTYPDLRQRSRRLVSIKPVINPTTNSQRDRFNRKKHQNKRQNITPRGLHGNTAIGNILYL